MLALPGFTPSNVTTVDAAVHRLDKRLLNEMERVAHRPGGSPVAPFLTGFRALVVDSNRIAVAFVDHDIGLAKRVYRKLVVLRSTLGSLAQSLGIPDCVDTTYLVGGNGKA